MKTVSVFGIAAMEFYKDAIRSGPDAAEARKYLVGSTTPRVPPSSGLWAVTITKKLDLSGWPS